MNPADCLFDGYLTGGLHVVHAARLALQNPLICRAFDLQDTHWLI